MKNAKIAKQTRAFKKYAHSDNIKILNSFHQKLQLKNIEFAIKNQLKKSLNEFRGFKFAITLVLKLKKQNKTKMKQNIVPFI